MKTKMKRVFAALLLTVACMLTCFGCTPANKAFKIVGEPTFSYVYDEEYQQYDVIIEGVAKNNSDDKMEWISLTFVIYDEGGNTIGVAEDDVTYVAPQGTWRFCARGSSKYEPISIKLVKFE